MIPSSGGINCFRAAEALSGDEISSTSPAATIDPAPVNTSVAPTEVQPRAHNTVPTPMATARNKL